MEQHVKIVALLHIVAGIIGVGIGLFIFWGFTGVSFVVAMNGNPDEAMIGAPIVAMIGIIITAFIMLLPVVGLICGLGLLKMTHWSRMLCIAVSIFYLPLHFPFGAFLGIYSLWVMFSSETSLLFHQAGLE